MTTCRLFTVTSTLLLAAIVASSGGHAAAGADSGRAAARAPASGDDDDVVPDDPEAVFVTVVGETGFYDVPLPAITADGRWYHETERGEGLAPPPVHYPTSIDVSQVDESGMDEIVAKLDELELLREVTYQDDQMVTDQGSLTLTIHTADDDFVHSIYAPGFETGDAVEDERRQHVNDFVEWFSRLDTNLGDSIGEPERFIPDEWAVIVGAWGADARSGWPFEDDPESSVCRHFESADDGDTVSGVYAYGSYTIAVVPLLPWLDCV